MTWFHNALAGGILTCAALAVFANGMARSTTVDTAMTALSILAVVLSIATFARSA
ncbi:hypothetical protein [Kaistia defluvii]|uniref:Uncharacterized protein n=1 Tax=Kaistia defluvii TaxID=410841 RepID=A0ABV2R161_9HYPH